MSGVAPDPLDRIAKAEVRIGPRIATLDEQEALVEVARAARDWDGDLSDYCDGPIRDRLRAALARLEGAA